MSSSLYSSSEFEDYYTPNGKTTKVKRKSKRKTEESRRRKKRAEEPQQEMQVTQNEELNAIIPALDAEEEPQLDSCTKIGRMCCISCGTACCIFGCWGPWCSAITTVKEWERGVVIQFGKVFQQANEVKKPGLVVINPLIQEIRRVDIREQVVNVPKQSVITKDLVSVSVDAVVYYKIKSGDAVDPNGDAVDPKYQEEQLASNVVRSVIKVAQVRQATENLAKSELRQIFANMTLFGVLEKYEDVASELQKRLDEPTDYWGIAITRVEILDIKVPPALVRQFAIRVETMQEVKGLKIQSQGEAEAAKNIRTAADELREAPGALTLRYLQICRDIATEGKSRLYFGIPLQMGDIQK